MSAGVGDGTGDWRLKLRTTLDIVPLAYVRTADGFLTSMHDVASEETPMRYRVPIFNPREQPIARELLAPDQPR